MKKIILLAWIILLGTTCQVIAQEFITTWKTDNSGSSTDTQITIPTIGTGYDYDVYWEEIGNTSHNGTLIDQTGDATIEFGSAGTYQIEISGDFPRIYFSNTGDKSKLLTIETWGDIIWSSMERAFHGCNNLTIPALDAPNLNQVTNMSLMFGSASSFNQDISHWDVSNVSDMSSTFSNATNFNQDIGSWDVSNVTNMSYMFYRCSSFDKDISSWNVSEVTLMNSMFAGGYTGTTIFNQDISGWDVGKVTNMSFMFHNATKFNQNIGSWDVSHVTNMERMFYSAESFNGAIGSWDVSRVSNMTGLFQGASKFNQDLNSWDVSNVDKMTIMFSGAAEFDGNISDWDVSNVEYINGMFTSASKFNQDIGSWDLSNAISISGMFGYASSFNQDIGDWQFPNATDLSVMFIGAEKFNQDISGWDVSKVTNMQRMFQDASSFNQDISNWDVSKVTDMKELFYDAIDFDQNLGLWDLNEVTDIENMLRNSGLSTANYDATLQGWESQGVPSNLSIGTVSGLKYCKSEAARQELIDTFNWSFSGDQMDCTQSIEFASLPSKNMGDESFKLEATTNSNLPVSYSSSNTDVASIEGNMVTLVGVGTTTITASQIGDDSYSPADPVDQLLVVNIGNQTISFDAIENKTVDDIPFQLDASSSANLPVVYTSSDPSVATISGNTVTLVATGTTTITASQSGNSNYFAADPVEQVLTVSKADQVIKFEAISNKNILDAAFELVAKGGNSGNAITFISSNPEVATVAGTLVQIVGTGKSTITASQAGNDNYTAAEDVTQILTIEKAAQTITFDQIENQNFESGSVQLNATASSELEISYELVSGKATIDQHKVSFTDLGVITIKASQNGNHIYSPASAVEMSFEVFAVTEVQEQERSIKIYPNPMSNQLNIEGIGTSGNLSVQLLNQTGSVVFATNHIHSLNNQIELPIIDLPEGMYVLLLSIDNQQIANKIQIIH